MTTFHKITVSPFATNILSLVDRDNLVTVDGDDVKITRNMRGDFILVVGNNRVEKTSNIEASAYLDMIGIGNNA